MSGYGDGDGYGYGDGDGVIVGKAGVHDVEVCRTPWGTTVKVGCQEHALQSWRTRWPAIARSNGLDVTAEQAAVLIAAAEAVPLGPEWGGVSPESEGE